MEGGDVLEDTDIQTLLDNPDSAGVVTIPAGEYGGKFIIRKSCTVNGGGAVFWNSSGPVLVVHAENVFVNGLKIELTNDNIPYEQRAAVYCCYPDTRFSDVEINGMLLGIPKEEQYWGLPKTVSLGNLAAEQERAFVLELYAPVEARLSCGFHDIKLSQDILTVGFNTVTLTVGKVRSGSLLYGYITVSSAVTRKIIISGAVGEGEPANAGYMLCSVDREAPIRHSKMLENLDSVKLASMPEPEREKVEIPIEAIDERSYASEDGYYEENVKISSGRRIPLSMKQYKIELLYKSAFSKPDIDGYMFMLGKNGFVGSDKRMIFFGNKCSECGSVQYTNDSDKRAMFVDFGAVPKDVTRMVLLFSIYGNDPTQLFSSLRGAEVSILCENGVHMHLPLESNMNCRTILALGFEKMDGVWEMISSGKGVGMSLEEICRSYGVTIIS